MKINGTSTFERLGTFRLGTADLVIASIPISIDMAINRVLPRPKVPTVQRGVRPSGEPTYHEQRTAEFEAAEQQWSFRTMAALAYHGLRNETRIQWDTPPQSAPSPEFYDRIFGEFAGLGLSLDVLTALATAVRALGDDAAKLQEAQAGFLPPTAT